MRSYLADIIPLLSAAPYPLFCPWQITSTSGYRAFKSSQIRAVASLLPSSTTMTSHLVAILGSTVNAVSTVHLMLPSSLNAGKITDMSRTVWKSPLDWIEVGNYV